MLNTIPDRAAFKEYCLRRLGKPVLQINVDDTQVEDRIDDALQYWNEFHIEGTTEGYLKHKVTLTDVSNGYIDIPDNIMNVTGIIPVIDQGSSVTMFDIRYQLRLHDIFDLNFAGSLSNYEQVQEYIGLLDFVLNQNHSIRYTRRDKKLYIDMDWTRDIKVNSYIVVKVQIYIDPTTTPDVWNDKWLKAYTTALIKKQWGDNLIKFEGVQLIGGVTMSGQSILDSAMNELEALENQLKEVYTRPVEFVIG